MSKRAATSELNHNNWDEEEAPEEAGVFETAAPDVIEKRVIRTAKRRIGSTLPKEEKKNAFSAFTGFGVKVPNSNDNQVKTSGSNLEPKENFSANKSENNNINDETYLSRLKGLNESFLEWIKMHIGKNPCCILTPIFRDYEKYLETINEKKNKDKNSSTPKEGNIKIDFKFNSSNTELSGNNQKTLIPLVKSSESPKDCLSSGPIFSFNSNKSLLSTNAPSSDLFKPCDKSGINSSTNITGFTIAQSEKTFTIGNVISQANREDEDSEVPPKNEFKQVTEKDSVFSQRVKVFVKKNDNFSDRGVGMLYVKPTTNGKYQVIVRADTSLGNILFNIILTEAIPTKRVGKNNVMLICIPTPDSKPPPTPVLLRVKTSEDADNLLAEFTKYKK